MWYVMWLQSHASLSSIKEKENQKKKNIKLRKIDKRKREILVFKCTITLSGIYIQQKVDFSTKYQLLCEQDNINY